MDKNIEAKLKGIQEILRGIKLLPLDERKPAVDQITIYSRDLKEFARVNDLAPGRVNEKIAALSSDCANLTKRKHPKHLGDDHYIREAMMALDGLRRIFSAS